MANRDYYPSGPAESARDREIAEKHLLYLIDSKMYLDKTAFMQYAEAITNDILGITYEKKKKAMKKKQDIRQNQRQPNTMVTSDMKMASLTSLEKVKHLRNQLQQEIGAYDDDNNEQNQLEPTADYQHRPQHQYRSAPPSKMSYDSFARQRQSPPRKSSSRDRSPPRHCYEQSLPQERQSRQQHHKQQRSTHFPPQPARAPVSQAQEHDDDCENIGYDQVAEDREEISKPMETNYNHAELDDPIEEDDHVEHVEDETSYENAAAQAEEHQEVEENEDELLSSVPQQSTVEPQHQKQQVNIEAQITSPLTRIYHTEELLPSPAPTLGKPGPVSSRPQQQQSFQDRPPLHQKQRQTGGRSRSPSLAQVQLSYMNDEDDEVDLTGNWIRPKERSIERLYPDVDDNEDDYDNVRAIQMQQQERVQYSRPPIRSAYKERQPTEIHFHNNNYHPSGIPAPPLIDYDPSSRYGQQQRSSTSPLRDSRGGRDTLGDSIDLSGLSLHRLRELTGHY